MVTVCESSRASLIDHIEHGEKSAPILSSCNFFLHDSVDERMGKQHSSPSKFRL